MCYYQINVTIRPIEKHMISIGIDRYLINNELFEHRCLGNIKKIYRTERKCDDQQQYNTMIETYLVSTPEICNDNIPIGIITDDAIIHFSNKCL